MEIINYFKALNQKLNPQILQTKEEIAVAAIIQVPKQSINKPQILIRCLFSKKTLNMKVVLLLQLSKFRVMPLLLKGKF